jgi:t-SNARE complex subunit (syntaxin)
MDSEPKKGGNNFIFYAIIIFLFIIIVVVIFQTNQSYRNIIRDLRDADKTKSLARIPS